MALRAYSGYRTWSFDRQCAEDEEDEKRVKRLFSYENFRLALQDEAFAEENIFPYWLNLHRTEAFLAAMRNFCGEHRENRCCARIDALCGELQKAKRIQTACRSGRPGPEFLLLQTGTGPFWWYFLRITFIRSMDRTDQAGAALAAMMEKDLPDLKWEQSVPGFLPRSGETGLGRMLSVPVGGRFLHIRFYASYLQYYLDDEPVWQWHVCRCPDGGGAGRGVARGHGGSPSGRASSARSVSA